MGIWSGAMAKSILSIIKPPRQQSPTGDVAYHAITPKYQNSYGKGYENGRPYGMVGSDSPTQRCGSWKHVGCIVGAVTESEGVKFANPRYYTEAHPYSCNRPGCQECYKRWAFRVARKSESRAKEYLRRIGRKVSKRHHFKLLHLVVEGTRDKKKIYPALKKVGVNNGTLIYHPWRWDKWAFKWRLSPHWHALGYGWVNGDKVKDVYKKKHITIVNIKPL